MKVARDIVENIQSFHEQYFSAKDIERYLMDKLSNPREEGDILMKRYSDKFKFSHKKLKYWCEKSGIKVYFDEMNEVYEFTYEDFYGDNSKTFGQIQLLDYALRSPNQHLNYLQDYKE